MSSHSHAIDDDFRVGPRQQTAWGTQMATAFFFGEVGAGTYFVAQFFGFVPGMLLGLACVLFGKGGGHSLHLGQRTRGWRAFAKLGTSWVSRGLLAIVLFVGSGALHVLALRTGLVPAPLAGLVQFVAVLSCLFIMVYQGFAMSHSSAITLWNSGLMPVTSFLYALLTGVLVNWAIGHDAGFLAAGTATATVFPVAVVGLVGLGLLSIFSLLHTARFGSAGGKESVDLLLRTDYAAWFLSLVVGVGLVLPGLLAAFAAGSRGALAVAAAGAVLGCLAFRILVFKAGTYDPVMKFGRSFTR